ncbi:DUF4232 domain-containing protein [Streptomyces scopuliridis]|uniref:DUF4232 domain-containing protein n=1 Tax=Streptomyces scopuliridis TaxID=452529 RepID=A0ACD4ZS06_9ACTN|nr:DUF4232 domain-containing protein [Streptomyces scopuliridis]WSC00759.1 DUF4232 domain-containing protein [Streptomyces scopuliridis]WSC05630.1 DUF4232 domain-containing protein [Streptomyces scopuliridis]
MARIRRTAVMAAGSLVLMAGASGCSDIRNEIDAARGEGEGRPTAAASEPSAALPAEPPPGRPASPEPWAATGPGRCLASGVAFSHGEVNAAMGIRAVSIGLRNCGTKPYRVNGYPEIGVLDDDREPVGLKLIHGNESTGAADDQGPRELTLAPGESVESVLQWNNRITESGAHATGSYVVVATAPGEERDTLLLPVDIGTDGELHVTPWADGQGRDPS